MAGEELTLNVERRTKCKKSATKKLRQQGKIPGVVYSHGQESVPLAVDGKELKAVSEHSGVLNLNFEDGEVKKSVLKDIQQEVLITDGIQHVDFLEVRADEEITVTVPVEPYGEAAGVRAGGMINQMIHEMDVWCLPSNIPEVIYVDISDVEIGDSLTVGDLPLSEKVQPVLESDEIVLQIAAPRSAEEIEEMEEEEAAAAGEEEMEPEVIEKGKREDEEEATEEE